MDKTLIKLNIKELRNRVGITQQQLADEVCSTKQNISKYERGEVIPPIDVLIDLANFFDVKIDELVKDTLLSRKLELVLDIESYKKYYNSKILEENLANVVIKNDIYISNINKELAVIDNSEDYPQIEYLGNNSNLDSYSFINILQGNYNKNLRSSTIHHTDSLLTVPEFLKIISSLGSNYDYYEKPGSIKLEILDEFIALVKLSSMLEEIDGKLTLEVNYSDLLLSQFYEYHDITFTENGYLKNQLRINELTNEKYGEDFDVNKIDAPMDEAHFLQYILETEQPETLERLYNNFNKEERKIYSRLGKSMVKTFVEKVIRDLLPENFDIKVNYDFGKPRMIMNGVIQKIATSAEKNSAASIINFIISETYHKLQLENKWDDSFDDYCKTLGMEYSTDDISEYSKNKYVFNDTIENYMNKYNDVIKTKWVFNKMRLLDLKTLKIIKSIIHKALME